MESIQESFPSVIQYYKGTEKSFDNVEGSISESSDNQQIAVSVDSACSAEEEVIKKEEQGEVPYETETVENEKTEPIVKLEQESEAQLIEFKEDVEDSDIKETCIKEEGEEELKVENYVDVKVEKAEEEVKEDVEEEGMVDRKEEVVKTEHPTIPEKIPKKRGRKRKYPLPNENESLNDSRPSANESQVTEENESEPDEDEEEEEDEIEVQPRKRGRSKKNPDIIPSYLSSDIVLGYKILLKFLETPQFSVFHKPMAGSNPENSQITCLNQIKRKFEDNAYKKISEFVKDVREMLTNIYESRNNIATKRALRLEQLLEQRIAQLPNYLRPQCALVLSPDDLNNSHNKIRINKGGGFVSLLLEKAEKRRCEKDKEKRKLMAEERKQLKEEQDKDVQEWEKNVLLKDHEEEIKSMWELPAIGHFIHLCTDILNIGEVAQYEVERMLLMPQCSDTLDLIMTALLSNSLVRAKLDRTPSMPYSIWSPLVTTRVISWYRAWHREGRNEQKVFEEIGVEPDFWKVLGPDVNPLDYYLFHELSLLQRVWVLKTLCDVDFVRKKTVYDNIRAQTLDELNPVNLGVDRHGNRYIQLKQFCGSDMRIYRQCANLDGDFSPEELIESLEGFEYREGPITADKVFKDIWDVGEKPEVKVKKKKSSKGKKVRTVVPKVNNEIVEKKNLRQSARAKQRSYALDSSDSDQSDTDLATLKSKLRRPDTETLYRPFSDKEFISLSVFRLPRDKVNSKQTPKRSSYVSRKFEECGTGDKCVKPEDKKEIKPPGFEDEASDSLDLKQMQDMQVDFEKNFQMDDMNEDDLLSNFPLDKADKTDPSNSEDSKIELPIPAAVTTCDTSYKYTVPDNMKPDSSKFYLVVDSVDGLRQLISKFGSHENDLEIISRSTKSNKKNNQTTSSCEVQLIERLQNLLVELEPWEWDLIKSCRSNREKMYKEYMNFINRPSDFVHPNEAYWMKMYEEPAPAAANSAGNAGANGSGPADATSAANADKASAKDKGGTGSEVPEGKVRLSPLCWMNWLLESVPE
ncbi:UNVERIFIED_CONTAM: hypothetical protein PYX00_009300 [Menopon gallinae]|uniref:Bromo domain-containing protein n=1 Tax=Menopon gallinae TaxID=328185 RepID=A0AAW2HAI1_9NEOP